MTDHKIAIVMVMQLTGFVVVIFFVMMRFESAVLGVSEQVSALRAEINEDIESKTADRIYRHEVMDAFLLNGLKVPATLPVPVQANPTLTDHRNAETE